MILSESSLSFYRTALSFALNYNNVLLQSAQRIRGCQIEQIDSALADCSKLSKKLEKSSNPEQMLTMGSELASGQVERTNAYLNSLSNVLGQNQLELAGVFQSRTVDLADGLKHQLEQTPDAIPVPFAATLKMMADVVHNTMNTAQQFMPPHASGDSVAQQHPGKGKPQESHTKRTHHH